MNGDYGYKINFEYMGCYDITTIDNTYSSRKNLQSKNFSGGFNNYGPYLMDSTSSKPVEIQCKDLANNYTKFINIFYAKSYNILWYRKCIY